MACAFNPIGDLYKKDVWKLSRYMGVPQEIIDKQPSADLWEGQTDEEELGLSYQLADEILERVVDKKQSLEEILAEGYEESIRSEEHTSELQSRQYLVCRLLLEKKNATFFDTDV